MSEYDYDARVTELLCFGAQVCGDGKHDYECPLRDDSLMPILTAELAAAEERGRRRGVEEAIGIADKYDSGAAHLIAEQLRAALAPRDSARCPDGDPFCACQKPMDAPRDSAPVVAPKVPTPGLDAAWNEQAGVCGLLPATVICSECGPISGAISPAELERLAPRDSGKVAMVKEFTREEAVAMFGPRKDRP